MILLRLCLNSEIVISRCLVTSLLSPIQKEPPGDAGIGIERLGTKFDYVTFTA